MSEANGKLVFEDLAPRELEVAIGGKEFILVEAMADTEVKYHDAMSREMSVDPDTKRMRVGAVHVAEPLAVSKCLFELRPMPGGKVRRHPVPLDTVLRWRPAVYQRLFKELAAMSPGLVRGSDTTSSNGQQAAEQGESRREQEKNSPGSGEGISGSPPDSEPVSTASWDGVSGASLSGN